MERWSDWLRQGERDLEHSRGSREAEWACFAAQQAAEKAAKALILERGGAGWGHSVLRLLESLAPPDRAHPEVIDAARRLDRYYIPARYPNGFDSGIPGDYFTAEDAAKAIDDASRVLDFCRSRLPRP